MNMLIRELLLTIALYGLTTFSRGITRSDLYEGDTCSTKDGGYGVCRKTAQCGTKNNAEVHCHFSGDAPVICCAVSPNATFDTSVRIVENACNVVRKVSVTVRNHVVGNAVEADVGDFPFMGLIIYNEERIRCGAALVSSRFLLTAAHCFRHGKPLSVRLGTNRADDPLADTYTIAKILRHPNYNRIKKQHDIAVVELKDTVTMSANVQPICLHTLLTILPESTNMTIMGWGLDNAEDSSNILLKGIVNPVPRSTCQSKYNSAGHTIELSDNQMCALGDKNAKGIATDSCQGDSGGPLVLLDNNKYYLAGVVSTGAGCGDESLPGIYTRISMYLTWVTAEVWKNQGT